MVRVDARSESGGRALHGARAAEGGPGARARADRTGADRREHPRAVRRRRRRARPSARRSSDGGAPCPRATDDPPPARRSRWPASARSRLAACLLAPLVGSTPIHLSPRVRPLDSVRRQRRRADLLRRAAAARARGGARRQRPGAVRRRLSGAAAQSARLVRHARRVGRRGARRDARDHLSRRLLAARRLGGAARQLRRLAWRARRSSTRLSAARRRGTSSTVLLLAGVTLAALLSAVIAVRAVPRRLHRDVSDRAVADGLARRRQLRADRRRARAVGARVRRLRDAAARARSHQHGPRIGRGPRRRRVARRADRACQRVAGHRRRGLARRTGSASRHHRAAPGPAARRRRPSAGAAGVGALRRVVSRSSAICRAHGLRRRSSCPSASSPPSLEGRSSYGSCSDAHDRARRVLRSVHASSTASLLGVWRLGRDAGGRTANRLAHPGHDRDAVRHGRRRPGRRASAATTTSRRRSSGCRASARCSIRTSSES